MLSGKDVFRGSVAMLLAFGCLGCLGSGAGFHRKDGRPVPGTLTGGRTRPADNAGPVAIAEPRPVPPPVQTNPVPPPMPGAQPAPQPPGPEIPTSTQTPPPVTPPADPLADVRRLQRTAAERHAAIESFKARLRRREVVNGTRGPEETLSFDFRKQPFSIHFKWLTQPGQGREVVFVQGQHGGNIHTLLAPGDSPIPLMKRIALPPNDPRVLARSRHPITEAGLGTIIDTMGRILAALDHGDRRLGTLTYLGQQTRPEYPTPLEGVEQTIPPGGDPSLPHGGRRLCYFDPANGLPVLVIAYDEKGQEVEYYCFDRFMLNVKLDDDDFNPDKLWRKP